MLRYRKLLGIDVEALGFDVFTSLGCLGNGPQTACNHRPTVDQAYTNWVKLAETVQSHDT